jgi:hypothetical protein
MRDIIQRHNRLNGLVFSTVEFAFIAVFIGAFAAYYLLHQRLVMAFIGWGITLNCLTVMVYGWRQWAQARAAGQPIGSFYTDKQAREQHRRENPHMARDTLILVIAAVLPFVMLLAVLFDIPKPRKE